MVAQRIEGLHLTAETMSMVPTREAVIDGSRTCGKASRQLEMLVGEGL